ncbi:hypothetical protein ECP03048165_5359 [Escherichia coli P0304816.5]|nr:hypothetical protein ECP02994382_4900 [Escherichia coli P0299438.2]END87851.1 hypothetical protein ECP02994833_4960 [Escherichia coli P0299483.3]ENE40114.1 hypothetical protein ECP030229310_4716 [Escherichia coli P0302293.10]ENH44381.1 hypothetical protein ECP03048165_5359 [Escherichia coli P0304816.5]
MKGGLCPLVPDQGQWLAQGLFCRFSGLYPYPKGGGGV